METFFVFVVGLALAYGVGCLGRKRKIGFGWAFFLSVINLFLGLIVTLCSKKIENDVDFIDIKRKDK